MPKLLLIEDEKILRENICELLEVHGFECITACHGVDGLEKALAEKPDLIICDIMVPYLTGFELKAELNKLEDLALTPVIFLSAKAGRSDLRQGMDLGAADYITKPFKISELVSSIKSRLAQAKNIQDLVNAKLVSSINDFIQISKHECNTPLNGIINLSGMLALKYTDQPEFFRKALKAINVSGKRLYKSINNIMDLLRVRNDLPITDQAISTAEIKRITSRILGERADHYRHEGQVDLIMECPGEIRLQLECLEVLLFEVLDNMFKFSSSGNPVVEFKADGEYPAKNLVLIVTNPIPGKIDFTEHDIGLFKQYDRDKNEQQGSGLGLFLVKTILEKYQGSITINCLSNPCFQVNISLPLN